MKNRLMNGGKGDPLPGTGEQEPDASAGWRRAMDPVDRLKQDADRYCGAVLYALRAEFMAMEDVRNSRSVALTRVSRVLRRSSADSLFPLVLDRLVERGLVRLDGTLLRFEPGLVEAWLAGKQSPEEEAQ